MCDNDGKELESHCDIVAATDWEIPAEVVAVHGITTERSREVGLSEKTVAELLLMQIQKASLIVAHNLTFDKFIARIAMRRYELIQDAHDAWWKGLNTFCTMKQMTNVCCISNGSSRYKYPKLEEAYHYCFSKFPDKSHDAAADVRACKEIYFWMKQNL